MSSDTCMHAHMHVYGHVCMQVYIHDMLNRYLFNHNINEEECSSQTGPGRESPHPSWGEASNRPLHLNGVTYWSNVAALHLGHGHHCSHCNM